MSELDEHEGVIDLVVRSMTLVADGVMGVELIDPDGYLLPEWEPGAHIDVGLDDLVRQYSLCGSTADRTRYLVAVLQEPKSRGGSSFIHEILRPGDLVEVGGPRNHFSLAPAKEYLFVAGGIGITPILPMIEQAERDRIPWRLHYGGRTRISMAFTDRLKQYGDRVALQPEDEAGRLDIASILGDPKDGVAVYCCGPTGLINAVEAGCSHWPDGALNVERFAGKDLSGLESKPFTIRCDRSDLNLEVGASETILDVLEGAGIGVANACRDGVCGSCEVAVLGGRPEHRDSFRAAGDDDCTSIAVCVSRSRTSEIVLDL